MNLQNEVILSGHYRDLPAYAKRVERNLAETIGGDLVASLEPGRVYTVRLVREERCRQRPDAPRADLVVAVELEVGTAVRVPPVAIVAVPRPRLLARIREAIASWRRRAAS